MTVAATPPPYPSSEIKVTDAAGALVATVDPGHDGRFSIALAPGRYTLHPRPTVGNPQMIPKGVTVRPGHFTHVIVWAEGR
jgi:hypothetical protein